MYVVCVTIHVRPDKIEEFIAATRLNHEGSLREPGVVRFDVLQGADDPSCFFLYEVYRRPEDFDAHKQTDHFFQWRDTVEVMMAEPRTRAIYKSLLPFTWE